MENPRVCFVDDAVLSVGGTSLTLNAIVEPNKKNVKSQAFRLAIIKLTIVRKNLKKKT